MIDFLMTRLICIATIEGLFMCYTHTYTHVHIPLHNHKHTCTHTHTQVQGDHDKASKILQEAIDKDKLNPTLYLQLLDLETSRYPLDEGAIEGVFQQVQGSELGEEIKHSFSLRRSQFLEEFGSDISMLV